MGLWNNQHQVEDHRNLSVQAAPAFYRMAQTAIVLFCFIIIIDIFLFIGRPKQYKSFNRYNNMQLVN
ncbi:hypothetical protein M0R45_015548 [Rubus argutus]|uniref:Uncharacterized protein n=1 Tax=Rubus argutus TaxID=59490 RepID=A0AAW1XRZ2_RUBAR